MSIARQERIDRISRKRENSGEKRGREMSSRLEPSQTQRMEERKKPHEAECRF